MLEAGANIEARDNEGNTSLIRAVACDKRILIETLLARGANIYPHNVRHSSFVYDDDYRRQVGWWQIQYATFIESRKAPVSPQEAYELLAATPLIDQDTPVDYVGNLRRIFTHAKWDSREQAEGILKEIHKDGMVNAETYESIMAATFPRERVRRNRAKPGGMAI